MNNDIKKTIKILTGYAGTHADNICPLSIEAYAKGLGRVLDHANKCGHLDIVLPGFPYKSANRIDKTMGKTPDAGEAEALKTLERLRSDIEDALERKIKVRVIICSDGFAFSDLKDIPTDDVYAYRHELIKMMRSNSYSNPGPLSDFTLKSLDDFMPNTISGRYDPDIESKIDKLRHGLMSEFADNAEDILRRDPTFDELHKNLTAFCKRDLIRKEGESKRAFKARCKDVAFNVACRSRAWAGLIKKHHPNALRLTIHPYTDVSEKFPISLVPSLDGRWRTPWHNVPCKTPDGDTRLAPRKYAEVKGYRPIVTGPVSGTHYAIGM